MNGFKVITSAQYAQQRRKWGAMIMRAMECSRSEASFPEVERAIFAGYAWPVQIKGKGFMLLSQRGDYLEIWSYTGRIRGHHLQPYLQCIYALARAVGLRGVCLQGRRGWARVLKPYGFSIDGEWLTRAV